MSHKHTHTLKHNVALCLHKPKQCKIEKTGTEIGHLRPPTLVWYFIASITSFVRILSVWNEKNLTHSLSLDLKKLLFSWKGQCPIAWWPLYWDTLVISSCYYFFTSKESWNKFFPILIKMVTEGDTCCNKSSSITEILGLEKDSHSFLQTTKVMEKEKKWFKYIERTQVLSKVLH